MGRPLTHGESYSPEYKAWCAMNARCSNPRDANYPRYGGRGIVVCERWASSFENFHADMGPRPPGMSLDRKNNDGNYTPRNCRWATARQQNRNYSRNRVLTWKRKTKSMIEWAEETGLPYSTIESRVRLGWPADRVLSTPRPAGWDDAATAGKDRKTHCANGHEYTPENSGRDTAGWRFCRACGRDRSREYMRQKRRAKR